MKVCYKRLWKLLIDKDMKKKDLCEIAGISPASITKMGRNGHVTTAVCHHSGFTENLSCPGLPDRRYVGNHNGGE